MSKPYLHAISSAKQRGGVPEDYLPIHQFLDSSKSAMADNRHRVLTHNAWFIGTDGPLELAFGSEILIPRDGKEKQFFNAEADIAYHQREIDTIRENQRQYARTVSVRDIGEQHVLEDFQGKFIPTAQDYIEHMEFKAWMDNAARGEGPSSTKQMEKQKVVRTFKLGD